MASHVPQHAQSDSNSEEQLQESWEKERKKREQLSSIMGGYLLKGYRMLGTNCPVCGMILMQTPRDGLNYCIQCSELDAKKTTTTPKTAPPLDNKNSPDTDATTLQESDVPSANTGAGGHVTGTGSEVMVTGAGMVADDSKAIVRPFQPVMETTKKILLSKLQWAGQELAHTSSVEHSIQLCALVKACADALKSVEEIKEIPRTE